MLQVETISRHCKYRYCVTCLVQLADRFPSHPIQFAAVLILIVLLEIAAAIAGVVHRSTVTTTLQEQYTQTLLEYITEYRVFSNSSEYDDSVNNAVDTLQDKVSRVALSRVWRNHFAEILYEDMAPLRTTFVDCTVGMLEVEVSISASHNDAKTAE